MSVTSTAPVTQPETTSGDVVDELIHFVCPRCFPSVNGVAVGQVVALCGYTDTVGHEVPSDPTRTCVVCRDLRPAGCGECGLR